MTRVLAIADEVVEWLTTDAARGAGVELVLAAGDLPFDYLRGIADLLDCPCVLVPGNHDPDLAGFSRRRGLWLRDGLPRPWLGPAGWSNADGRVVTAAGLRIAGLGGSIRYNGGPNQWTERQQAKRARRLVRSARRAPVDVLLAHSPPRDLGDRADPPHRGFGCLRDTVRALAPTELLHGHIHPHGARDTDRDLHGTPVRNVVGHRIIEVTPEERAHAS